MMFNGRNIIPDSPDELTKVVNFLNEKTASGEFEFIEIPSYWAKHEGIIAMAHAVEGGDELIVVLSIFEDVLVVNAAHHDVVGAGARGFAGTQDEKWLRKYEEVVALVDEQMTLEDEDVFWRFCVKWDGKC